MMAPCYLGIDVGTQGLTALLVESSETSATNGGDRKTSLKVLAMGEGSYDFVPGLPDGCYEQDPSAWETALVQALKQIQESDDINESEISIASLCVTGQMHGCVMIDAEGRNLGTARLWCDARNQEEADELSELFGERMPKRLTAARYLWSMKHEPKKAQACHAITTPAGYIAHRLTTRVSGSPSLPPLLLGAGEASGMFPIHTIDGGCCEYQADWIEAFDNHVRNTIYEPETKFSLEKLLPKIRTAGDTRNHCDNTENSVVLNPSILEPGGWLSDVRELLTSDGEISVAPAEGDQPTALAASLIGEPGMISCSFGTSVVANMVGRSSGNNGGKNKISLAAVDRFNAVNGQPISMVWLRNGTTYLNRMVESYGGDFELLLKQAVDAPPDCGGLLALPFLDDEPGLGVKRGGTAMIVGFNNSASDNGNDGNHRAGNVIKAAMISVMFNLLLGTQQVEEQAEADENNDGSSTRKEIVLTGGLTKTPQTGQILANIFDRPVRLMEAADEGGAWGAALLAKYYDDCGASTVVPPSSDSWLTFLNTIEAKEQQTFHPETEHVAIYRKMLRKYKRLLLLQPQLNEVMNEP
ncbi:unnamed protein product [Pseudo-nitzschia multistriata]|uniref:Carbohydrate kinase FGGY C-terminal domain-containing protein n=1 Tax=Pseudo-nitzschia multistriata TaxID=183589 RepID=A0A448ZFV6_9STRA|nr:unnamed protein product [Pseudo-nitzschia multistriata]